MSITVRSNEQPQPEIKQEDSKEQTAPEAKTSVQNEALESETNETEQDEAKDELEMEAESQDDAENSNESKDDKPKKKSGFQRRIDKLNARNTAAAQEIEYWKQQALKKDAIESKVEKVESKSVDGKPDPEHFESHSDYVEALTDWKIEMREKAAQQKAQKSQIETEQANAYKIHAERVKSFADKTEDFQEVLESVDDVPVSVTVQECILSSENGPALMYELAKNRAEYERICKLPPIAAARELGKIEFKIASNSSEEKKQEPKKLTNAPKPIAPVGSKSASVLKSLDDPNLSQAEYERIRAEQLKRKRA